MSVSTRATLVAPDSLTNDNDSNQFLNSQNDTESILSLPKEVNRILFVKNLPFKITGEQIVQIFSKFGALRHVRLGNEKTTRGSAYIVYYNVYDAKRAYDSLTGFNVKGRYLSLNYYKPRHIVKLKDSYDLKEEMDKISE